MSSETKEPENTAQNVLKLAICLWKLDNEDQSGKDFGAQDKAGQLAYKNKAKKLIKLLENRKITLAPKS